MATKYLTLNMQELHVDIPQKADTTQVSIVSEQNTHADIAEEECARFADAIDCRSKSDHLTLTIPPQQPTTTHNNGSPLSRQ